MKLSLACMASLVLAAPHKKGIYSIKDKHPVPSEWLQLHRAPKGHTVNLCIGVKQGSFSELERHLYEVSDPDHERLNAVHEWLEENNVRLDALSYSPAKDWILVALSVSEIEHLLDTVYHVYENDEGSQVVRTPQYSLPRALHRHIDVIQPTNYFGGFRRMGKPFHAGMKSTSAAVAAYVPADYDWKSKSKGKSTATDVSAVCNPSAVTSLCLRTLYNTINYVPQVPEQNSIATTNFLDETSNVSDFHIFLSRQRHDASLNYTFDVTQINGGINHQDPETGNLGALDFEGNLDVQTVGGIAYPTRFTVFSTGGTPPFIPSVSTPTNTNEPYLEWLNYLLAEPNPPHSISTSYSDDEQSVPLAYATRICQGFAQLGARGVTLLFPGGDEGVGVNGTCVSNDGKSRVTFLPEFPSSCPYVTTVGATRNISPEIVAYNTANGYVSGSGLSNYFPRPSYQDSVVSSYLDSIGTLHKGLYNASGRAYPDLAAQGYQYIFVYFGRNAPIDGTSAATPAAAGVFALVNDALIAAGKRPLGFLNPALYKTGGLGTGFTDVLDGSTWGCDTSGFPAKKGWDLASGFGTPDFLKTKETALEMAERVVGRPTKGSCVEYR